jgi:F-box interacting protein
MLLGMHNHNTVPFYSTIRYASMTGLGFDPRSKKYKLARFFYQRPSSGEAAVCKLEVHTLGTNVWRRTADDPPYGIAGRTPVHVQGSIYWILIGSTWGCPQTPHTFLRFSLADEKFSLVPFPPSDYKPAHLMQSETTELCCTFFCDQKRDRARGLELD